MVDIGRYHDTKSLVFLIVCPSTRIGPGITRQQCRCGSIAKCRIGRFITTIYSHPHLSGLISSFPKAALSAPPRPSTAGSRRRRCVPDGRRRRHPNEQEARTRGESVAETTAIFLVKSISWTQMKIMVFLRVSNGANTDSGHSFAHELSTLTQMKITWSAGAKDMFQLASDSDDQMPGSFRGWSTASLASSQTLKRPRDIVPSRPFT